MPKATLPSPHTDLVFFMVLWMKVEKPDARLLAGIFFISGATLCFEIVLIRYFSVSQQYHFAFLVVSIAFLGYGASGTFLSLFSKIFSVDRDAFLSLSAFLFALFIFLSYLICNTLSFDFIRLAWDTSRFFLIPVYFMVLSIPFLFSGLILSFAATREAERIDKIYFFDLLGAGSGTLLVLIVFLPKGDKAVIPILSLLGLSAALVFAAKKNFWIKTALSIAIAGILILSAFPPSFLGFSMSSFKALPIALHYPEARLISTRWNAISRVDIIDSPAVRFAPGLSLLHQKELAPQLGLSVDGDDLAAVTASGTPNPSSLDFLSALPSSAVYSFCTNPEVLIIEPKGNLDVLAADRNGAWIKVVENNPLLLDIKKKELGAFSGNLYQKPNIEAVISHGRSAVRKDEDSYDLIVLPLTDVMGSTATGFSGFGEDYLLTTDSFIDILNRLKPEGYVSQSLYLLPPPRRELRVIATWIEALEETGKDPRHHILSIRSWGTLSCFVKKGPVSKQDVERLKAHCEKYMFDLVYYPGIRPEEANRFNKFETPLYYDFTKKLLSPEARKRFYDDYLFSIRPVPDDRPFFHNYFKIDRIGTTLKAFGQKWFPLLQGEFLVPLILLQAVGIAFVLILLPLAAFRRRVRPGPISFPKIFGYFGLIGMAFMFVEIILIQKIILYLGHPLLSFSAILFTLLASSGLGSLFSRKIIPLYHLHRLRLSILLLSISIVTLLFLLPPITKASIHLAIGWKLAITVSVLFPSGFLMGFPFPSGIRLLKKTSAGLIPWAWAVNAFSSVISSVAALLIAFYAGYNAVLFIAAGGYLLTLPFLGFSRHRNKPDS